MILTQCACCAVPLPHLAKQCSRCKTRYCGAACQAQHWKEGGHDKLCKKIRKGGGAEQFHANKKYAAAVTVAAEACAEDTKDQTCYFCTEAVHWKTKEGLVRGCACRGTAGFAHVSCLAEQAKILVAEAEENNLSNKVQNARLTRWHTCSLCEQDYHGVVVCALGWACWKTYLGRPEADQTRGVAIGLLGNGLSIAGHDEDAMSVKEVELSTMRRLGASARRILSVQGNLAISYQALGRLEEALEIKREVYSGILRLNGEENFDTLREANNYAASLLIAKRFGEAKSLMRKSVPVARRVLGESKTLAFRLKWSYAMALYKPTAASLDDLREAVMTLEETERAARRALGGSHPHVADIERTLREARDTLSAREAPSTRQAD